MIKKRFGIPMNTVSYTILRYFTNPFKYATNY